MNNRLEAAAGRMLHRKVTIDGSILLTISLHPALRFSGLSIANPSDWETDNNFVTAEKGSGQVDLLPLLQGEFRIEELAFEGVILNLITRSDQNTNYRFPGTHKKPDSGKPGYFFTGLDLVSLRNIRVSHRDERTGKEHALIVDSARGQSMPGHPLTFTANGHFFGQAYSLEIEGTPLPDLIQGAEPWHIKEGKLTLGDMILAASGTIAPNMRENTGSIDLSFSGNSTGKIGEILGFPALELGAFSLDTRIAISPGMLFFNRLRLNVSNHFLTGDLGLTLQGKRPALKGNIDIPMINPALFSMINGSTSNRNGTDALQSNFKDSLPWEMLKFIDADIHLRAAKITTDLAQVENLNATLSLSDGDLMFPFSVVVMDSPVDGRMEVITSGEIPRLNVKMANAGITVDALFAALEAKQQFTGQLGPLALESGSRGNSIKELSKNLDIDFRIGATRLSTGSVPLFNLEMLTFKRKLGNPFFLSSRGDFLNRPFNLQARAGGANEDPGPAEGWLNLRLEMCDTHLLLASAPPADQQDAFAGIQFSVNGKNLCGLLDPIQGFMGRAKDFSAVGKGGLRPSGWFLDFEKLRMGDVVADGVIELSADPQGKPLIKAKMQTDGIDLLSFLPESGKNPMDSRPIQAKESSIPQGGAAGDNDKIRTHPGQPLDLLKGLLTRQLLPRIRLLSTDAVLDFYVKKLKTGRGQISDVKLRASLKDGKLVRSPFQAKVAGVVFTGNVDIDITREIPSIHLDLASRDFNLPDLFREFQLGRSPDITADRIGISFELRGNSIQEFLVQSTHVVTIDGGKWIVERELSRPLQIDIEHAEYRNMPDTPSHFSLKGFLDSKPITMELIEDGLMGSDTSRPFKVQLNAGLADTQLTIDGSVTHRIGAGSEFNLNTLLSGGHMNDLNRLLGVDLPPLGPYKIGGALEIAGEKATLHDLIVRIGASALKGDMVFTGKSNNNGTLVFPLHLETRLKAESIQLDDFQFGDWSPWNKTQESSPAPAVAKMATPPENKKVDDHALKDLISPQIASMFEGSVEIEVGEVLSGRDKLGDGKLSAKLENGRYSIDRLNINIPGGTLLLQGALRPEADKVDARFAMQVEHLDYGILIRRAIPNSHINGELNFSLDLHSIAENPSKIKEHLNGHLRIGVVPEDLPAGIIDLWAVNILTIALPALMKGNESEINCLAANFTLTDGLMRPEVFLLDTSKMRVQGMGEINFKTGAIDFHMKPTPKSAEFFSLATPIHITNTITHPHIGVSTGDVLHTIFSATTGVLTVPFQRLFGHSMEADGQKACSAAMDWVKGRNLNQ